jgi:hypothetical protein
MLTATEWGFFLKCQSIVASQFKEASMHYHRRFMQAIKEKVIPPVFAGEEKPNSTTLSFPIDYRPADEGVCPDCYQVRGSDAGIEKVLSGLCAWQVETVGMSEETSDPFERAVAGSRCPTDVVPDSNGRSCALWWAQVRLLKQKRALFELNFP